MASKAASTAASKYGPIWGRGYESLINRRILSVIGSKEHATSYLQGLVTSDLYSEPRPPREEMSTDLRPTTTTTTGGGGGENNGKKENDDDDDDDDDLPTIKFTSAMRSTCFLDHRGRIITDAMLWRRSLDDDYDDEDSADTGGDDGSAIAPFDIDQKGITLYAKRKNRVPDRRTGSGTSATPYYLTWRKHRLRRRGGRSTAASKYGPIWGRGYESLINRRILSVIGSKEHATSYLQGLVTSDLYSEPRPPREEMSTDLRPTTTTTTGGGGGENNGKKENDDDDDDDDDLPTIKFTSAMRSTCFLDHRGRIITDAMLWRRSLDDDYDDEDSADTGGDDGSAIAPFEIDRKSNNTYATKKIEYLIDVPSGTSADALLSHLRKHRLRRSRVVVSDVSDAYTVHAVYGTLNSGGAPGGYMASMDPRHPSLGMRVLSVGNDIVVGGGGDGRDAGSNSNSTTSTTTTNDDDDDDDDRQNRRDAVSMRREHFENLMGRTGHFPPAPGTYSVLRKLAGIAEGDELRSRTAIESNMEFLNAISFDKGCYLGQELTARSNYTGVVRKRIVPLIVVDTDTEVPRPWIMAGMMQELSSGEGGIERVFGRIRTIGGGDDGEDGGGGNEGGNIGLGGHIPPPLPRLSAPGAGSIASMLMGSVNMTTSGTTTNRGGEGDDNTEDDDYERRNNEEQLDRLRKSSQRLMDEVNELAVPGASIIDKIDGKTIGKVVSTPASGTTVLLAQMRLDRLGLLRGDGTSPGWSRTNRILIGEGTREYRYLPYLPLWWPEIDGETGKEKIVVSAVSGEEEEELDEL
ncbi:hypothetical protein ACHAXA_000692 [Cyclostephanos tholiformis]|uniref:Transferase CAF17, mitochondrial n=1 Tax=Cyclostephanos tholiformis TaxID=382380 RepID=A0ABD3R3K3_9STRA